MKPSGRRAQFEPRWVTELDVRAPSTDLVAPLRADGCRYEFARVLVRSGSEPIAYLEVELSNGRLDAARLARQLEERRGGITMPADDCDGAGGGETARSPFVSVIIASRDRGDSLRRALASVVAVDYPAFEIVVVDSASRTDETARAVEEFPTARVRLVREPRGGLSRARNLGARVAAGPLLAFTDDDVVVDRGWLRAIARGFARGPGVDCVTGLVPSAQLETSVQAFFDARVGWGKLQARRLYDLGEHRSADPRFPYFTGLLGTGANFALTRSAFERIGPFDEILGAGSAAHGGEDLDYFLRILLAHGRIAYEPAAVVWHVHRDDPRAMARQLYGYGSGLTAFMCKYLLRRETRWALIRHLLRASAVFAATAHQAYDSASLPLRTQLSEIYGMAAGPVLYLGSRQRQRREGAAR
jgi:GT2 family glycosyltransferase